MHISIVVALVWKHIVPSCQTRNVFVDYVEADLELYGLHWGVGMRICILNTPKQNYSAILPDSYIFVDSIWGRLELHIFNRGRPAINGISHIAWKTFIFKLDCRFRDLFVFDVFRDFGDFKKMEIWKSWFSKIHFSRYYFFLSSPISKIVHMKLIISS